MEAADTAFAGKRRTLRDDLISSYFIAQGQRPSAFSDVDLATLTPYLRALLVTDGAVTRLLEGAVLESVEVRVLDQRMVEPDGDLIALLELPATAFSLVRRRIAICGRQSRRTYAFAESVLVPSRLPSNFIGLLAHNPRGLGESIDQMRLETRRELLWFGHAAAPAWAAPAADNAAAVQLPLLTRSYRLILGGTPSILISESFPIDDPTSTK